MNEKTILIYTYKTPLIDFARTVIEYFCLFFLITFNYKVWNGDWYVTVFALSIFLLSALGAALNKRNVFHSWEELEAYIKSEKEKDEKKD